MKGEGAFQVIPPAVLAADVAGEAGDVGLAEGVGASLGALAAGASVGWEDSEDEQPNTSILERKIRLRMARSLAHDDAYAHRLSA